MELKINTSLRRAFTLLEVVIALFLATILTSGLLTAYFQICKKRLTAQELKKNSLAVELMRQKLLHLFGHAPSAAKISFETGTHPAANGTCLLFTYDHGIDREKVFCGDVLGMLYQNRSHQLCLATWGSSEQLRQEVLLTDIDNISFIFFNAKKKEWTSEWKKEDLFPPFFKLSWASSNCPKEIEQCAFFFPQDTPIIYETEGLFL
jgi:prepilin-type N-terminal cleavage/methylation domain-containing protein